MAGSLLAAPLAFEGQQVGKMYRVGILGEKAYDPSAARLWQAFRLALLQTELYRKEFEILISTVPTAKRIAVLWNPDTPSHTPGLKALEESSRTLRVELQAVVARTGADLEGAFSAMARAQAQGVLV